MYQVENIPFKESDFISLLNTQTQEIFVSPKSICEIFEIAWKLSASRYQDADNQDLRVIES